MGCNESKLKYETDSQSVCSSRISIRSARADRAELHRAPPREEADMARPVRPTSAPPISESESEASVATPVAAMTAYEDDDADHVPVFSTVEHESPVAAVFSDRDTVCSTPVPVHSTFEHESPVADAAAEDERVELVEVQEAERAPAMAVAPHRVAYPARSASSRSVVFCEARSTVNALTPRRQSSSPQPVESPVAPARAAAPPIHKHRPVQTIIKHRPSHLAPAPAPAAVTVAVTETVPESPAYTSAPDPAFVFPSQQSQPPPQELADPEPIYKSQRTTPAATPTVAAAAATPVPALSASALATPPSPTEERSQTTVSPPSSAETGTHTTVDFAMEMGYGVEDYGTEDYGVEDYGVGEQEDGAEEEPVMGAVQPPPPAQTPSPPPQRVAPSPSPARPPRPPQSTPPRPPSPAVPAASVVVAPVPKASPPEVTPLTPTAACLATPEDREHDDDEDEDDGCRAVSLEDSLVIVPSAKGQLAAPRGRSEEPQWVVAHPPPSSGAWDVARQVRMVLDMRNMTAM